MRFAASIATLFAAVAPALGVFTCPSDLSAVAVGSGCSLGSVSGSSQIAFSLTRAQTTEVIRIGIWNAKKISNFDAETTITLEGPDGTTFTEGTEFSTIPLGTTEWGYGAELDSSNGIVAGNYTLTIANSASTAKDIGVFIRVGPTFTGTVRAATQFYSEVSNSYQFEVTPIDQPEVTLVECMAAETREILKSLSASVTNGGAFGTSPTIELRQMAGALSADEAPAASIDGDMKVTRTWNGVHTNDGAIKLRLVGSTPADYDIENVGPYTTVTMTIESIERYPLMDAAVELSLTPGQTSEVYRVERPSMWYKAVPSFAGDDGLLEMYAAVYPSNKASITAAPANKVPVEGWTNAMVLNMLSTFIGDVSAGLSSLQLLSPRPPIPTEQYYFVVVQRTSYAGPGAVTGTVKLDVELLPGECQSYRDCDFSGDEHPSLTSALSVNMDEERLRHCMIVPQYGNPNLPMGRCVECTQDCDCGAGQYCHMDAGVCNKGGILNTCDQESARNLGLCRRKDPTSRIIGQPCRSGSAAVAGAGMASVSADVNTGDLLLVSEGSTFDADDIASANNFCGEARYFNSSAAADNALPGAARVILWEGSCFNGLCEECSRDTLGANACNGRRMCISGEEMDAIDVDGTIRTFTSNTVAGTLLAAVMMLILLQGCVAFRVFQARKYHKQIMTAHIQDDAESVKA